MSIVINAPTTPNNGGFELRATQGTRVSATSTRGNDLGVNMAGHTHEGRITQEQGTH